MKFESACDDLLIRGEEPALISLLSQDEAVLESWPDLRDSLLVGGAERACALLGLAKHHMLIEDAREKQQQEQESVFRILIFDHKLSFLGLPDPDPFVRGTNPDPDWRIPIRILPSSNKISKKTTLGFYCVATYL